MEAQKEYFDSGLTKLRFAVLNVYSKKYVRAKDYDKLYGYLYNAQESAYRKLDELKLKSITATTLLTIFLGGLSAGRFYLKDYFFAVIRIAMLFAAGIALPLLNAIPIFGSFLAGAVSLGIIIWYVAEIFICRAICAEHNLEIINATINAEFAHNILMDCGYEKTFAETVTKQRAVTDKMVDMGKKYLNKRYWEFIKPQLAGCDENVIDRIEELKLCNKTKSAVFAACLGFFGAGRIYLKDFNAVFKIAALLGLIILTVFAHPIEILNILSVNATVITAFIFYFEEIIDCREITCKLNFQKISAYLNTVRNKKERATVNENPHKQGGEIAIQAE